MTELGLSRIIFISGRFGEERVLSAQDSSKFLDQFIQDLLLNPVNLFIGQGTGRRLVGHVCKVSRPHIHKNPGSWQEPGFLHAI